jgi:hypothetical protein
MIKIMSFKKSKKKKSIIFNYHISKTRFLLHISITQAFNNYAAIEIKTRVNIYYLKHCKKNKKNK